MENLILKIKYALSLVLYFTGISLLINKLIKLSYGNRPTLTVLCYHSVDEHQASNFERHLDYLLEHDFKFISEKHFLELISFHQNLETSSKYILLTFDDCYENSYSIVRPMLIQKKIPAIFFAVTLKLDHYSDWHNCNSRLPLMTKEQLKNMALSFDIGGHTQHHVRLSDLPHELISCEIKKCKEDLEELLGREIVSFAYPYGSYNEEVLKSISKSNFKVAFTLEQHSNYSYKDSYTLGRYIIDLNNFTDFKLKVMGGYDWFFFIKKIMAQLFLEKK